MGFNTSSIWIKIALILLCLATVLFVIGFATVAWMSAGNYRHSTDYGLWKIKSCDSGGCRTWPVSAYDLRTRGWDDWYKATQAFECMGLICLCIALLILFLFIFVDRMRKRSPLIAVIVFTFAAVVFMVIGFVIFATQFEEYVGFFDVGWSMGISIAASVCAFIAGVFCLIDLKK